MTDRDVTELPRLLDEMTSNIPSVDDDNLIEHLRGDADPVENLDSGHGAGIIGIVNMLAEKEAYHGYSKTFTAILKYSLLAVQRFCQGDTQVPCDHLKGIAGSC